MPAIDGVAVGRILSIGLDGNDSVWLELPVTTFESEENCMGYVQNQAHLCPELGVPQDCFLRLRNLLDPPDPVGIRNDTELREQHS